MLHAMEHDLRLRISKARIVLKHLRSIGSQHQPEEDHALERTSLRCHGVHRRLVDIFLAELFHFFRVERARRERSQDRKSTRLNSSHVSISYAVCCLKKKTYR